MAHGILKIIIYLISAALIFLGLIFMIASYADINRFFVGLAFLVVSGFLIYFGREKKPIEIRQTVTLSGPPVVKEVRCPNCGAMVDPTKPQIVAGRPYVTCSYCGNKFELTEEPKW